MSKQTTFIYSLWTCRGNSPHKQISQWNVWSITHAISITTTKCTFRSMLTLTTHGKMTIFISWSTPAFGLFEVIRYIAIHITRKHSKTPVILESYSPKVSKQSPDLEVVLHWNWVFHLHRERSWELFIRKHSLSPAHECRSSECLLGNIILCLSC